MSGVLALAGGLGLWASLPGGTARSLLAAPGQPPFASCEAMAAADLPAHGIAIARELSEDEARSLRYRVRWPGLVPSHPQREETQSPQLALSMPQGRLLGSSRGEFGGELMFRTDVGGRATYQYLYSGNVQHMFAMPYGIVATTGYGHLEQEHGSILLVVIDGVGRARVRKLRDTAKGAWKSWVNDEGDLVIDAEGEVFLLKSPTDVAPVRCREHWWQF